MYAKKYRGVSVRYPPQLRVIWINPITLFYVGADKAVVGLRSRNRIFLVYLLYKINYYARYNLRVGSMTILIQTARELTLSLDLFILNLHSFVTAIAVRRENFIWVLTQTGPHRCSQEV